MNSLRNPSTLPALSKDGRAAWYHFGNPGPNRSFIGIGSVFRLDLPRLLFPRPWALKRPRRRSNRRGGVERLKERAAQVNSDRKNIHGQAAFEQIGSRAAFRSTRLPWRRLSRRVTGHHLAPPLPEVPKTPSEH